MKLRYNLFTSFTTVFSSYKYIVLAAGISLFFCIIFSLLDTVLFFSPIFVFYLPNSLIFEFILSNIAAILMGIMISMNVYVMVHSRSKLSKSLVSGTVLGTVSSACASCSYLGFLIISTFGGLGVLATNFLSNFQIPLRLLSIGILILALYTCHKHLTKSCTLYMTDSNQNNEINNDTKKS